MREHDLSAKYLVLPPNIDIAAIVIDFNTKLIEDHRSSTDSFGPPPKQR